jgi:hypothetical protein
VTTPSAMQQPEPAVQGSWSHAKAGAPSVAQAMAALAQRVQAALAPVEPRAEFLVALGRQLAVDRPKALAEARARESDQRLKWVAGVGGPISLLGLGIVGYRAAQALSGRLASRTRRAAVSEPVTA